MHFLELALESCAIRAVGHVGDPFAKLVLSVPEVLAMFRILGRRGSAIPWRRRRGRRPADCGLASSWHRDLSLSVS